MDIHCPLSALLSVHCPHPWPVSCISPNAFPQQVEEGLGTVGGITAVPTFNPAARIKAFNMLGEVLQDERAAKAKRNWGMPLKAVVISGCGVL